ncbi:type I-E CRISPR-associated protein Cas5/CasD [Actinomadura sp. DC4]|uniref:type I-E CRISPR-associated protein Cas5/CasD n=1 Tax=Actinomadura sp. DC4 TaxID=3055069 RepID=UPI0025B1C90E|nr:type I-E CRISPR-associated protein Cas5/CasD [Actinomadura sp. DC4]MDN3355839.1 type I-E CRISPR-associated protein Cas5/CasD [Actinomadura sp. DC4]
MSGLLLRLSGPLQSWGEHSTFDRRDTLSHPTRSGLIGLFAAAQGRPRSAALDDMRALELTVRVDRRGRPLSDFHTVGGGLPRARTVPTAEGKRRPEGGTTLVSRRHYLADACFTVAVAGPDDLIAELTSAVRAPVWAPYLGRRSCPPDAPFLLADEVADPAGELERIPLNRMPPRSEDSVTVDFLYERQPADAEQAKRGEVADVPYSFAPDNREYRTRPVFTVSRMLPALLCAGRGEGYVKALATYLGRETR